MVFWSAFPVFWIVGSLHQDYRKKLEGQLPNEFWQKTSLLPFKAIIEGRNSLVLSEFNGPVLIGSVAVGLAKYLPLFKRK